METPQVHGWFAPGWWCLLCLPPSTPTLNSKSTAETNNRSTQPTVCSKSTFFLLCVLFSSYAVKRRKKSRCRASSRQSKHLPDVNPKPVPVMPCILITGYPHLRASLSLDMPITNRPYHQTNHCLSPSLSALTSRHGQENNSLATKVTNTKVVKEGIITQHSPSVHFTYAGGKVSTMD